MLLIEKLPFLAIFPIVSVFLWYFIGLSLSFDSNSNSNYFIDISFLNEFLTNK